MGNEKKNQQQQHNSGSYNNNNNNNNNKEDVSKLQCQKATKFAGIVTLSSLCKDINYLDFYSYICYHSLLLMWLYLVYVVAVILQKEYSIIYS